MKKATNAMLDPKYLLLDFEQALSDGFQDVFPNVIIARDRFHFVQANVKRLNKLGLQNLVTEVSQDLSVLWEKPCKEEFDPSSLSWTSGTRGCHSTVMGTFALRG